MAYPDPGTTRPVRRTVGCVNSRTPAPTTSRLAALVAAPAVLAALVAAPGPAVAAGAEAQQRYQGAAVRHTNGERTERDLVALKRQKCVQKYAVKQARWMAANETMAHQDLQPILSDCGLRSVGENVAYGYAGGKAVVAAWMDSPGHRANILEPSYRLLGLAARTDDDGTWYVAQVFGRK